METKDDILQMPEKDLEFLFSKEINDHPPGLKQMDEKEKITSGPRQES